ERRGHRLTRLPGDCLRRIAAHRQDDHVVAGFLGRGLARRLARRLALRWPVVLRSRWRSEAHQDDREACEAHGAPSIPARTRGATTSALPARADSLELLAHARQLGLCGLARGALGFLLGALA